MELTINFTAFINDAFRPSVVAAMAVASAICPRRSLTAFTMRLPAHEAITSCRCIDND